MTSPASIIIPTLNEEEYLPVLLTSLKSVKTPLDIIVVDGNSEDGTRQTVERFKHDFKGESSLRFLQAGRRGISLQRNTGGALAKHQNLIFCDADIVFPSDETFQTLLSEFREKNYVVAMPPFFPIENIRSARIIYKIIELFQKAFLFFGQPYFGGACLFTTADTFKKVGGFDTSVLLAEDVDYSFRAAKIGRASFLRTPIPVSARRFLKYGTVHESFKLAKAARHLIFNGKVTPKDLFYPFGDYGDFARKK